MSDVRYFVCRDCRLEIAPERDPRLVETTETVDGVTWTTVSCPTHGPVFVHADAGELDLGIIREQAANATNDYEAFVDHAFGDPEQWKS